MRVISRKAVVEYSERHADAAASLDAWYRVTRRAEWHRFADVQAVFSNVDRIGDKYVFNIAHNRYRLIAEINFQWHCVFVRRILTHAEYERERWH